MKYQQAAMWSCLVLVLFSGCSSWDKPHQDTALQTPAMQPDEPVKIAPAELNPQVPSSPSTPPVSLGPGQAKVTASVVETETRGHDYICTLHIQNVHGYGPATMPLAAGSQVRAMVQSSQLQMAGDQGQKLLQPGSMVDLTMRYQMPMAGIQPPPPEWSILAIH